MAIDGTARGAHAAADDGLRDLVEDRVTQVQFAAELDPSRMAHTVRVWQVAPIRDEWTAVIPMRAGQEEAAREQVAAMLATVAGPGGGSPRNAVGLLERHAGRRGTRFDPADRARWPEAALYLEFMPAGADMVYAHYELAYVILETAAPLLADACWYAILSQCEDVVDRWEIADGVLRFERLRTAENRAREVLELLDPTIAAVGE